MDTWQRGGFGLYVHWPFCAAKCPYCDFNSHVGGDRDPIRWRAAYLAELAHVASMTPGRVLGSVFFGGGTPSLMEPDVVGAILEAARGHWTIANDLEVTLEANPTSVEASRFAGFVDAGVTRFSVGMQALDDADLKRLGRLHSAAEARRAFEIARSVSDNVSLDLIYARQDQSRDDWRRELGEALAFAGDHLSLYQLTIEAGTPFAARRAAGGLRGLPDEDLAADLYDITQDLCGAGGLARYEVSNHARPGREARHNLVYWRAGDWAAIGPGAHGRLTLDGRRVSTVATRMPEDWLSAVSRHGQGFGNPEAMDPEGAAEEVLLSGLRLAEGLDRRSLRAWGHDIAAGPLAALVDDGLAVAMDDRVTLTERGILLLDAVVGALVPLEPVGEQAA